jgi:integrase/recombinase XerD
VTERGIGAVTAAGYADKARPFLACRQKAGVLDLVGLTAAEVTAFIAGNCPSMRKGTAKLTVTALRSLLGYLHVAGDIPGPLAWAVPAVATWRLASLPAPLEPGQVAAMLAGCDTGTASGRRDLALLALLARLGLRAGEVAALSLDDIDWRAGEVTVTGKGRRSERLPLPARSFRGHPAVVPAALRAAPGADHWRGHPGGVRRGAAGGPRPHLRAPAASHRRDRGSTPASTHP